MKHASAFTQFLRHETTLSSFSFDENTAIVGNRVLKATNRHQLRRVLARWLYLQLHARNSALSEMETQVRFQDLASRLRQELPSQDIVVSSEEARAKWTGNEASVRMDGVKVRVPKNRLVRTNQHVLSMRIPRWRANLTPGFFFAMSSIPKQRMGKVVRYYIACSTPDHALRLWRMLAAELEATRSWYQMKALSASSAYPRSDAIVVYSLDQSAKQILDGIEKVTHKDACVGAERSIFTSRVSEHVATAEEPSDQRTGFLGLSFGQHRSLVLADTLIDANRTSSDLVDTWIRHAEIAQIDPRDPSKNLSTSH